MLGRIVDGKYRLLRLLGEGGMGAVYEAEPVAAGVEPRVAIKLLQPEVVDDGSLARFHREIRAASAVDTEHIARVIEFGTDRTLDAPYMVMELLHGEDLEQLLARVGRLPPDTVLRIAAQVCLALEKAHGAGVMHRDIKPANLFLARRAGGDVVVKILDFGIAKMKRGLGEQASIVTPPDSLLCSPRYMSPEQAKAPWSVDFRTDLWSLGMVLYHALTGTLPYHQIVTLAGLILAIGTSPPRLAPELVPWVPREVASVVHGALELDPARRFASAAAMLDALRPLLPDGWSLDEGMLAGAAGEPGPEETPEPRHLEETVRLAERRLDDAHAETTLMKRTGERG